MACLLNLTPQTINKTYPTQSLEKARETALFEGTVVITRCQEQGRGQRGTTWESKPGQNLTFSILLFPSFLRPEDQFQLNKVVSLGVMEFVTSSLISSSSRRGDGRLIGRPLGRVEGAVIKWPNDIYVGNKKVAGVLIENSVSGNKLQQSIVGIGVNVNQEEFSPNIPNPTSLKLITGKEFDLEECLSKLCACIEKRYLQLRAYSPTLYPGEEGIDADYLKNLYLLGEWATYKYKGDPNHHRDIKAKITGITKIGKLKLEMEEGTVMECDFKEVGFLG